jgi:hypothetical protein
MKLKISPAISITTLLCFLLPFASVSCGGPEWHVAPQNWGSATGFELATRTVQQPIMLGPVKDFPSFKGDAAASVAALAGIVALALGIFAGRNTLLIALLSVGGALSLCVMKHRLDALAAKLSQEPGMMRVQWKFGFWLVLFLFVVNAAWNADLYFTGRAAKAETAGRVPGNQRDTS